ncbi:MAG: hypothetical protein JNM72_23235 [Deltaproteobacteria bacterium]|nr:hypothetical protein [Deltaproteobacteria bacterium]
MTGLSPFRSQLHGVGLSVNSIASNVKWTLLRWLVLPFAALFVPFAGVVCQAVVVYLAGSAAGVAHDGWFMMYVNPAFGFGLFGFLYSKTVTGVAPSHKQGAGAIMTALLGLIVLSGVLLIWIENTKSTFELWVTTAMYLFTFVTAVLVLLEPGWRSGADGGSATG